LTTGHGLRMTGYSLVVVVLGVAAMTGFIDLLGGAGHLANISLLYLLVVLGAALRYGSGAAVLASILSFLAFDWFFVEPRSTLTVRHPDEWLALLMFLVTATVTGQMTALLRARAEEARRREAETAALSEASWAIASQVDRDRALAEVLRRLTEVVRISAAAILVREEADGRSPGDPPFRLVAASPGQLASSTGLPDFARGVARRAVEFVLEQGRPIAWGTDHHHWAKALIAETPDADGSEAGQAMARAAYLPLTTEQHVLGVLYVRLEEEEELLPAERRVVESLANHAAVVVERDRLTRAATQAQVLAEADRLKTALLSMVSHDFRSPLASIKTSVTGLLQEGTPWDAATQRDLLQNINQAADRLNRMVGNILALSRLEADAWRPQVEATPVEELVGAVLDSFTAEQNRRIEVSLDPDLTEIWVDPVQIVQVLHNLVDNALKYSPTDRLVEFRTSQSDEAWVLEVLDRGPGVSPGDEERIFDRFYRAPGLWESAVPGVGIGLAVCRGLVQAHGGHLTAANRAGGGAVFRITLPKKGSSPLSALRSPSDMGTD
jgi:two-component system, OmpR family, sensor histidine kinase KdpD